MPRRLKNLLLLALLVLFAVQIIRLAWVSDDAYITFRSVENFIHGYGPVYNVGERVQTYTHPLWFGLLAVVYVPLRLLGISLPLVSIGLSLLAAAGAAGVFAYRIARGPAAAAGGLALLLLCKAVLDYSTSGLEDALTFLLLAVFWARFFALEERGQLDRPGSISQLSLLAALGALNRLDTFLFYLPAVGWIIVGAVAAPLRKNGIARRFSAAAVGLLPLVLWEAFSLFYYGFPFPNTAYAKLNTGIPRGLLLAQGGRYALDALARDPAVWVVILGALLVIFLAGRRAGPGRRALAAGMAAYVLYVIWIGGDFMAGRFWAAPVFAGVILLGRGNGRGAADSRPHPAATPGGGTAHLPFYRETAVAAAILSLAAIFILNASPWRTLNPSEAHILPESGIVDERAWYFPRMGLFNALRSVGFPGGPPGGWIYDPAKAEVRELDTIGVDGYTAGPNVYVLDRWALADPLLARLPVEDPLHWRIGHFRRRPPEGYVETLQSGKNVILNPKTARFYEQIRQVTRGPLASPGRLAQAARLLVGQSLYK